MTNSYNHGGDKILSREERDAIMEEMLKIDLECSAVAQRMRAC